MNDLWSVLAVAAALGTDALTVSLGLGFFHISRAFKIKFVSIVASYHVVMPLLGLYVGRAAGNFMGRWASILGAIVLFFLSIQMLRKSFQYEPGDSVTDFVLNNAGWWTALLLGLSVSVDALAVGFSLGTARFGIINTVMITGTVAGIMTGLGWTGSKYFGENLGKRAQALGGLILMAIAVKMFI